MYHLSDRQQLVDVAGSHSANAPITCGVQQELTLGPLLFLIYVNDMSEVINNKLLLMLMTMISMFMLRVNLKLKKYYLMT